MSFYVERPASNFFNFSLIEIDFHLYSSVSNKKERVRERKLKREKERERKKEKERPREKGREV